MSLENHTEDYYRRKALEPEVQSYTLESLCPKCKNRLYAYWHTPSCDHPEIGVWYVECTNGTKGEECKYEHNGSFTSLDEVLITFLEKKYEPMKNTMENNIEISINEKIRNYIEQKGVKLTTVAIKVGLSNPNLHRLLNANDMKFSSIKKFAEALDLPLNFFIDSELPLSKKKDINNSPKNYLVVYQYQPKKGIAIYPLESKMFEFHGENTTKQCFDIAEKVINDGNDHPDEFKQFKCVITDMKLIV